MSEKVTLVVEVEDDDLTGYYATRRNVYNDDNALFIACREHITEALGGRGFASVSVRRPRRKEAPVA